MNEFLYYKEFAALPNPQALLAFLVTSPVVMCAGMSVSCCPTWLLF